MSNTKVKDTLTLVRGEGENQSTMTISVEGYSPEWVDRVKEVYLEQGWAIASHKQKVAALVWWTTPYYTPANLLGVMIGMVLIGVPLARMVTGG